MLDLVPKTPGIKELRKRTGLSQYGFASKFHMNPANISNWERDIRKPPDYVVYMMQTILEQEKMIRKLERMIKKDGRRK